MVNSLERCAQGEIKSVCVGVGGKRSFYLMLISQIILIL